MTDDWLLVTVRRQSFFRYGRFAIAERMAKELQTAQPEYVVLVGITKMQWRQGVLDVTCDAVAPIGKP